MASKNYSQAIITYYPLILKLKQLNYSLKEILEVLKREYNFIIESPAAEQYLSTALKQIKNNTINKKFEHYVILGGLLPNDALAYEGFCVKLDANCYLTHVTKNYNKAYLVNESNIHQLDSVRACLIAKRILRLHNIPDEEIIQEFIIDKNKWSVTGEKYELSANDETVIKTIHDQIINIFETSIKELKSKPSFYKD